MQTLKLLSIALTPFLTFGSAILRAQEAPARAPADSVQQADREFLVRLEAGKQTNAEGVGAAEPKTSAQAVIVKPPTVKKKTEPRLIAPAKKAPESFPKVILKQPAKPREIVSGIPFRVVRITTTTVTTKVRRDPDEHD